MDRSDRSSPRVSELRRILELLKQSPIDVRFRAVIQGAVTIEAPEPSGD